MKVSYELNHVWPKFILNDKNGYAVAKALDAGMKYYLERVSEGLDTLQDVSKMPGWRLDELAWEYDIPYDPTVDIEIRRRWVSEALKLSRMYGTAEGISRYMGAYFEESEAQESWEYGGEPNHFRMVFPGSWTPENVAWAIKAANTVKNVRSLLDELRYIGKWRQMLYAGGALYTYESGKYQVPYRIIEADWYIDEDSEILLDEDGIVLIVE